VGSAGYVLVRALVRRGLSTGRALSEQAKGDTPRSAWAFPDAMSEDRRETCKAASRASTVQDRCGAFIAREGAYSRGSLATRIGYFIAYAQPKLMRAVFDAEAT
jgi:hypothetical protein